MDRKIRWLNINLKPMICSRRWIDAIQDDVVRYIYRVNVVAQPKVENRLENASTNNRGEGDDI